jgi:hypothetical protein
VVIGTNQRVLADLPTARGDDTAGAVVTNDLDDLIEERGTFTLFRVPDPVSDAGTVRRMTGLENLLQPSARRLEAERNPRRLGVSKYERASSSG